jgi:hypothetical protein
MAEDQRAPGQHVVDVPIPVDIDEVRAFAALDEERRAADGPEGPNGRADTAREETHGLREQLLRPHPPATHAEPPWAL